MTRHPAHGTELIAALRHRRCAAFVLYTVAAVIICSGVLDYVFRFLPSPAWREAISPLRTPLLLGGFLGGMILFYPMLRDRVQPLHFGRNVFLVLAMPLLCLFGVTLLIDMVLPAAHAGLSLKPTTFQATVARPRIRSRLLCRDRIELEDVPSFSSRICGVAPHVKSTLHPGSRVALSGRGSKFGIFFYDVRRGAPRS